MGLGTIYMNIYIIHLVYVVFTMHLFYCVQEVGEEADRAFLVSDSSAVYFMVFRLFPP